MRVATIEYEKMARLKNRSECRVCRVGKRLFYAHRDERGERIHRVCNKCFEEIEKWGGRCHLCRKEILGARVDLVVVEENLELMERLRRRSEKIFRICVMAFSSLGIFGSWILARAGLPEPDFYPSLALGLAGSLTAVGLAEMGAREAQRKLLQYFERVLNQRLLEELEGEFHFSGL